ncbi:MAG: hypothetical protein II670_01990 [Alphaproteobacteria bacterium]|nr:hypothetical protein [Alphaproteobacteria bacterium]
MTIIITLLVILIFGVFILHLYDKKKTDNNFNKVKEFETETSKSFLTIIKTIQKVERNVSAEDAKIVNEHIFLVKLIEELDKKGIVDSKKLIEEFNKNKGDEI